MWKSPSNEENKLSKMGFHKKSLYQSNVFRNAKSLMSDFLNWSSLRNKSDEELKTIPMKQSLQIINKLKTVLINWLTFKLPRYNPASNCCFHVIQPLRMRRIIRSHGRCDVFVKRLQGGWFIQHFIRHFYATWNSVSDDL